MGNLSNKNNGYTKSKNVEYLCYMFEGRNKKWDKAMEHVLHRWGMSQGQIDRDKIFSQWRTFLPSQQKITKYFLPQYCNGRKAR